MKLDRKLAEAVVGLEPHPYFQHIVKALREDLADSDKACRSADGTPLYRAQGKSLTLLNILETVDDAREFLKRTT